MSGEAEAATVATVAEGMSTPAAHLAAALTEDERAQVPPVVAEKLERYIDTQFEQYITSRALHESTRSENSDKIKELENSVLEVTCKYEDGKLRLVAAETASSSLEQQVNNLNTALEKAHNKICQLENELTSMKSSRDAAVDERNDLTRIVQRRDTELERLTTNEESLLSQLRSAIDAKCEALALSNEVQSKEMSLEYREKRMEQERVLLNSQIAGLSEEVNRLTSELQTIRLNSTSRLVDAESQLAEKSEELNAAKSTIVHLTELKNTLTSKAENLAQRLLEQREIEFKMSENYRKELEAKTKLADLFKSMHDDDEEKTNELTEGIVELQKMLSEATEKYGELETKNKQMELDHEELIEKKNEIISSLKSELENANDLVKAANAHNLDRALGELAPSASAASKLLKSGMSLTQIYSQLVKLTDELAHEKEENRRLNLTITTILQELEEKAPMLQKQRTAYEEALESNMAMTQQLDSVVMECNQLRDESAEATRIANHYNRENSRLKGELADLGRQVCFLLKEVEQSRTGTLPNGDHDPSLNTSHSNTTNLSDISSNLVSKALVTFSNIQELQTNNQKLLRMVRELTDKQEEYDRHQSGEMQSKLDSMKSRVTDLTEAQDRQTKMINALVRQRDMFKKLYHDLMNGKRMEVSPTGNHPDSEGDGATPMETQSANVSLSKSRTEVMELNVLETKLKDTEKHLEHLKDEYKTYKEEKMTNERMLIEQIDNMRKEIGKLTASSSKSAMTAEYNSERLQILQANITTYKKQISCLEERNKMFTVTIGKHEVSAKMLRDEALNAQGKLASAEVAAENLKMELMLLKDAESRLRAEREAMGREQQGQALLLNNLEMIKASVERAETEGRMRLESRLDEATRECSALRLRLQEEQDRFRELADHLERQTNTAKTRMQEEKDIADSLRAQLAQLRQDFTDKCKSHEDIAKKLKTALTPESSDGTLDTMRKVKNLENELQDKMQEMVYLQKQISTSEEHIKQYCGISECAEKDLANLRDEYLKYKDETQAKLHNYETQLQHYQERCSELEAELSIQNEGQSSTSLVLRSDLSKLEDELKGVQANLDSRTAELELAMVEIRRLSESVQRAEEKYSHEVVLHSTDIQTLTQVKQEASLLQQQLNEIKLIKDQTLEKLESEKTSWLEREKIFTGEIEEFKTRFENLTKQNSVLHDQLQALGTQLSVADASKSLSDSINESAANRSANVSIGEDDNHSSEQLIQIIKLLRKEKDIAVAKFNILQAETSRVKSELEITQNKLDETTSALEKEREKSEVNLVTVGRQSDILRKVETLNALTDSNRVLREERDGLQQRIDDLTTITKSLEDQLVPMQEKISDLTSRNEVLQTDNNSLKADISRWRGRVNNLVERANKTSPEDWKRLQNERETLAKMLTNEKEMVKKLNEETVSLKAERARVEEQLANLSRQHGNLVDEHRRQSEELQTIRSDVTRITDDLNRTKAELTHSADANTKINEEMASKEIVLAEIRNKELQIRKIAKKYKVQYEELAKSVEEEKKKSEGEAAASDAAAGEAARHAAERLGELEALLATERSDNLRLKADLETLQAANNDKEEKAKQVLKHAKTKIVQLTEAKNNLTRDLNESRGKLEAMEQSNRDEQDVRLAVIKSQFEGRLLRLEKERAEAAAERTREVETLTQKVSLLQRQLASQVSAAKQQPTADKVVTEPPTANIKPMAGVAQQSVSGSRRGGETPLASIRPMAQVGPTAPHDAHSTEYMPASSSRPLPRATVSASPASSAPPPPPPESTQDMDVSEAGAVSAGAGASDAAALTSHAQPPQQGVALVMPRIEQAGASSGGASSGALASSGSGSGSGAVSVSASTAGAVSGNISGTTAGSVSGSTAGSVSGSTAGSVSGSTAGSVSGSTAGSVSGSTAGSVSGSTAGSVSGSTAGSVSGSTAGSVSGSTAGSVSGSTAGSVSASTAGSVSPNVVAAVSTGHSGASAETGATPQSSNGGGGVSTSHAAPADARAIKRPRPPSRPAQPSAKRSRVQAPSQGFERSVDIEYQVPTSSRCDQDDENVIVVDSEEDDDRCTGNLYQEGEGYAEEDEEEEDDEEDDEEPDGSGDEVGAPDDESSHAPHESPAQSSEAGEAGEAEERGEAEGAGAGEAGPAPPHQQIETISSGTEPSGALSLGGADEGDDSIVPSTPTLYVPRRTDGFGEAVVSPVGASAARFTFAAAEAGAASHHDTHADLAASLPPPPPPLHPSQRTASGGAAEGWAEARSADEEAPAVSSQGSRPSSPHQVAEEGREAEASASPTRGGARRRPYRGPPAASPRSWHSEAEQRGGGRGGRGARGRGGGARRSHNSYVRY